MHTNVSRSQQVELEFSVPQDNMCGPVLYTVNASTLQHFMENSRVACFGYAKDNSAYDSFNATILDDENRVIRKIRDCFGRHQ